MKTLITLLSFFAIFQFSNGQSTENFEAPLPLASNSFTRDGLSFITSNASFNTDEFVGFGSQGSDRYLDNLGATGLNSSYSISISGGASTFVMESIDMYLSSNSNASVPTDDGTITVTGKLGGTSVYSYTKTNGFPTSVVSSPNNGYITIDFTNIPGLGDVSTEPIDEIELSLNGSFVYISVDNFSFNQTTLGTIDNQLDSSTIAIHPIPVKNQIIINNSDVIKLKTANIFDLRGRLVKTFDLTIIGAEKILNASNLESATYILQIITEKGALTKRFIKD